MRRESLDTLLFGGPIYGTKDFARSVGALGIRDGKIAAVGRLEDLDPLCGPETARRDLMGKALIPGLIDPHTHFFLSALIPRMAFCRTPPLRTMDDIVGAMRTRASRTEFGRWVVGWGYNEVCLKEKRHPTAREMEKACPDHPAILMHASFHQCVLNPLAMELCGIDRFTEEPYGGRVVKDLFGRPNGILLEKAAFEAFHFAWKDLVASEGGEVERLLADLCLKHLGLGIVAVSDASVSPLEKEIYERMRHSDTFPLSLDMMEVGRQGICSPPLHLVQDGTQRSGFLPTVKLFLDGAEQCAMEVSISDMMHGVAVLVGKVMTGKQAVSALRHLAQLSATVDRQGRIRIGFFVNDPDQISRIIEEGYRRGYPIAVHALGNRSVSVLLDVYERVTDRYGPSGQPLRIEHCPFLTRELIDRMAKVGAAAVVQPSFLYDYGPLLQSQPLPKRLKILPLREMLDRGVLVAGSSDAPCSSDDPLWGMRCAVRREAPDGECLDPEQSISKEEALRLYTVNAAKVLNRHQEMGCLEEGKRANLVVLSADPFRYGFQDAKVVETIIDGRTVWKASRQ